MKIEKEGPVMRDPEPRKTEPQNTKLQNTGPEKRRSDDAESEGNRTPAMAGLAIAVVLLVVGLWLAHELTAASKMQDCLMSGRTNCNVIQPQ
jgi:hypothetical protein